MPTSIMWLPPTHPTPPIFKLLLICHLKDRIIILHIKNGRQIEVQT